MSEAGKLAYRPSWFRGPGEFSRLPKPGTFAHLFFLSALVVLSIHALAGFFASQWISQHLLENTVEVSGTYMEGIVAPKLQELENQDSLSLQATASLDKVMSDTGIQSQIEEFKIWLTDGTIVYASDNSLIGRQFASPSVIRAAQGEKVINFETLEDEEERGEIDHGPNTVELYMPIRSSDNRVIAVGEFYHDLSSTHADVLDAVVGIWAMTAAFLLAALLTVFAIGRRAVMIIRSQRMIAVQNHRHAYRLHRRNEMLERRAKIATRKAAQANEHLLSRVGAEIHDSPVQLLSLAQLFLNRIAQHPIKKKDEDEPFVQKAIDLIGNAVSDLRALSSGLILPEIERLSLHDALRLAVSRHEGNTGTSVEIMLAELPFEPTSEMKVCMYRVVQESLNNSTRHGEGKGQSVQLQVHEKELILTVADEGPGIRKSEDTRPRLGLLATRNRVEAFGGKLMFKNREERGTILVATFPLGPETAPQD